MELVQRAMETTGIPTFANAWKPTDAHPTAPDTYVVYNTMTLESEHWDDGNRRFKIFVYLNLWTKADPTEAIARIRSAMRTAGFSLSQELDSYDDDTGYTLVACTWVIQVVDEDGT